MEYKVYGMNKKEFKERFEEVRMKNLHKYINNPEVMFKINKVIDIIWFGYKIRWLIGERIWYLKKTH